MVDLNLAEKSIVVTGWIKPKKIKVLNRFQDFISEIIHR